MNIDTYINIIEGAARRFDGLRYRINNRDHDSGWQQEMRSSHEYWVKENNGRHRNAQIDLDWLCLPNVQISIRPLGFWADVITLRINPRYNCPTEVDLSWGSGGVDPKEVADIGSAAMYLASALTTAASARSSMMMQFRAVELAAQQTTEV